MFGTEFENELLACYVQEKGEQQSFKQDKSFLFIINFVGTYYATETLLRYHQIVHIRPSNDYNKINHLLVTLLPLVIELITLHVLEVCVSTLLEST